MCVRLLVLLHCDSGCLCTCLNDVPNPAFTVLIIYLLLMSFVCSQQRYYPLKNFPQLSQCNVAVATKLILDCY